MTDPVSSSYVPGLQDIDQIEVAARHTIEAHGPDAFMGTEFINTSISAASVLVLVNQARTARDQRNEASRHLGDLEKLVMHFSSDHPVTRARLWLEENGEALPKTRYEIEVGTHANKTPRADEK